MCEKYPRGKNFVYNGRTFFYEEKDSNWVSAAPVGFGPRECVVEVMADGLLEGTGIPDSYAVSSSETCAVCGECLHRVLKLVA